MRGMCAADITREEALGQPVFTLFPACNIKARCPSLLEYEMAQKHGACLLPDACCAAVWLYVSRSLQNAPALCSSAAMYKQVLTPFPFVSVYRGELLEPAPCLVPSCCRSYAARADVSRVCCAC